MTKTPERVAAGVDDLQEAANLGEPHDSDDRRWLGTYGDVFGAPEGEELERIREAFGNDVSPVHAMRIHRMRVALSIAQTARQHAEANLQDVIERLRVCETVGEITTIITEYDEYPW